MSSFHPVPALPRPARARRLTRALPAFLLPLALLGLAPAVRAQEGTGQNTSDPEAPDPDSKLRVQAKGDRMTRREKREAKRLAKERERARKEQKKWEKMGLAARTAPEWYAEALKRYKGGKYLQAREILLPLEDSPRALDIQDKVKLLIADTYYYQGGTLNLAEALARYRSFLTFYPTNEHAEYARFQLGNCYYKQLGPADRDQSYTDNAVAEYDSLLRDHPNGEYAEQARQRMLEAKALQARHEFEVAKFYHSWGNLEATVGRLEELLRNRPESPDREEALYLLAQSLYDLGRPEQAEAWAARLRADHPGSKLVDRLRPSSGAEGRERAAKRAAKREKHEARTYRAQRRREERRTRQVRKDSGLPAEVPRQAVAVESAPASSGAAVSAAPDASGGQTKSERRHRERMEKLEAEEQRRRERELERERRARAESDEPKSEKQLRKEAARAEKLRAKEEKHARRMEKAEAREQAEAEREAEKRRRREEKRAEKAAREAEKEAEKKAKKAEKRAEKAEDDAGSGAGDD